MATITDTHTAAAEALVSLIPTDRPLAAAPSGGAPVGPQAAEAFVASFTATDTTDMALALIDYSQLANVAAETAVDVSDILHPALEAAGTALGSTGSLGQVTISDAVSLFEDADATVFELRTPAGPTVGWFAMRTRKRPSATGAVDLDRLSRISNVDMTLTVEVGRTKMPVRDLLSLEPGGIVELDRSAGAPADVLVNGRIFARGEVVVVDGGDFGVRITKILGSED